MNLNGHQPRRLVVRPSMPAKQDQSENVDVIKDSGGKAQPPLQKKNGRWYVILLVGGATSGFEHFRALWGTTKGIEVKYHWDYEHQTVREVPKDVDMVVIIRDWVGHAQWSGVKAAAKHARIPVMTTGKDKARWSMAFYRVGIKNSEPLVELEAILRKAKLDAPKEPEPEKIIRIAPPISKPELLLAPPIVPVVLLDAPKPTELPAVNLVVAQQTIPVTSLPTHRAGSARPETAALIAALHAMCIEDQIVVIVDPKGFEVKASTL